MAKPFKDQGVARIKFGGILHWLKSEIENFPQLFCDLLRDLNGSELLLAYGSSKLVENSRISERREKCATF